MMTLFHDSLWYKKAACIGQDTELFFSESPTKIEHALDSCDLCPVKYDCRSACDIEEKSDRSHIYGTRGGETAEERKARRGYSRNGWTH